MQDNQALLLQWREIDQNGYLSSHVGGAMNIFGVDAHPNSNCGNQEYDHSDDDNVNSVEDDVNM